MSEAVLPIPERPALVGLIGAVGLQMLAVRLFSLAGLLHYQWIVALLILLGAFFGFVGWISRAGPSARLELLEAWQTPWPLMLVGLLLAQIVIYPPMMSDSLSYRLPRMFFALQEGRLGGFATTDFRMTAMPWGWESLALPFATFNLLGWSRLISLSCWITVYQILFRFGRLGGADPVAARWGAVALATAPVFVLLASSTANDLLAGTLLLIGLTLMVTSRRTPSSPVAVLGSLLSLVMAANVKPQFLVLGVPWLLWWIFAPGKPWRSIPLASFAVLAPLFVLVSPLLDLGANYLDTGSLSGITEGRNVSDAPAWRMVVAGSLQFLTPQLQLPIFPGSEAFSRAVQDIPLMEPLGQGIPKFNPGVGLMPTIDGASYGLLHFGMLGIGLLVALKKTTRMALFLSGTVLLGFMLASSQVVVSTMARSFAPFLMLILPLVAMTCSCMLERVSHRMAVVIVTFSGVLSLILNPSAPLWPVSAVRDLAVEAGEPVVLAKLDHYLGYQHRAETGRGILDPVPEGQKVGILIRQVTPMTALWQPDWRRHQIDYVHRIPIESFAAGDVDWLLVADKFTEFYPEVFEAFTGLEGWRVVNSSKYLPNLSQGSEVWRLYHRSNGKH